MNCPECGQEMHESPKPEWLEIRTWFCEDLNCPGGAIFYTPKGKRMSEYLDNLDVTLQVVDSMAKATMETAVDVALEEAARRNFPNPN